MRLTPRESVLGVATLAIILFGGTAILARPRLESWRQARAAQAQVRVEIEKARRMIEQKAQWQKRYAELSRTLPRLPAARKSDVHWLSVMERIATQNGLSIGKRQAGEEKDLGAVYELPLECQGWKGTLDGVVRFLYDLQAEGAMFDVRHLWIKPKDKDSLGGNFTLYCAYTREAAAPAP